MRHTQAPLVVTALIALVVAAALPVACSRSEVAQETPSALDSVVGAFGSTEIDYGKPTHIIVIGYSGGMGEQFVQVAVGKAQRYREVFPGDQVVLMGQPELTRSDTSAFNAYDIKVTEYDADETMTANRLLDRLERFQAIASFDYFGHSAPWSLGVAPSGKRFGTDSGTARTRQLASHFTGDAYATLNGCNAGLYLAPYLSKHWRIPVSGALTSTNFQHLYSNNKWYVNETAQAPGSQWAQTNDVTYSSTQSCGDARCLRMKPDNVEYHGFWGNQNAGLGHFKFFCKGHTDMNECYRRMAVSLLTFPSTSPLSLDQLDSEKFRSNAFEYLCPNDKSGQRSAQCPIGIQAAIAEGSYSYSPFQGNNLICDFDGCDFDYVCQFDASDTPIPSTCAMTGAPHSTSKSIAKEFEALMKGLEQLKTVGLRRGSNMDTSLTGPIPADQLQIIRSYTVNSPTLNCRSSGSTSAGVVESLSVGRFLAVVGQPQVMTDANGKSWVRVKPEDSGTSCYVSAQYQFIRPN